MDSKENALESSANICPVEENTGSDLITNFAAEKPSETGNKAEVELESNRKEVTSKADSKDEIFGISNDEILINEAADVAIGSVGVKYDEIETVSSTDDLKAEVNTGGSLLTMKSGPNANVDVDVDLVQMVSANSGTASDPEAITDVTIDDENLAQKVKNDFEEIIDVAEYNFPTKNNSVKNEPLERNKLGKRKQGDKEVIMLSSGSDTDLATTSKGRTAKQTRTDPAEEKKRLIQLIRSYPVLYDSKHSDVKTVGSKKAAYQEIGSKMGLTYKQISTRWYNYYKTYKTTRNDPLLSFLAPFIDDSEASTSGSHSRKAKNEDTNTFESSDESSNKSEASTSRLRKTKKVRFVGLSDESASDTDKESYSDDIKSKKRPQKGDNIWDISDEEFIVLIRETIVGLDRAERKQLKKRIAKTLQF